MQRPLLSVLIPTHNRQRYAIPSVRSIAHAVPDGEIILCDTSENDELSGPLRDLISSARVKILRPGRPLSVVDNFNTALAASTGKFVTFLGDDDFLDASVSKVALWAEKRNIDALRCSFPASYYWPDFASRYYGDGYSARLAISDFSGRVKQLDARAAYGAALDNLGAGVGNMPRAYLGIISRPLIDVIVAKHGALFGGVSPDIYSAALISSATRGAVEIDYPFIVPGSSGASTSGLSAKGQHKGDLWNNDHIRPFVNLQWDKRVPEFYSVPSVWSYSLLKAAEELGEGERANFCRMYVKCALAHPSYLSNITPAVGELMRIRGRARVSAQLVREVGKELLAQAARVGRRLRKPVATSGAHTITGLADCGQASAALSEYLAVPSQPKLQFE